MAEYIQFKKNHGKIVDQQGYMYSFAKYSSDWLLKFWRCDKKHRGCKSRIHTSTETDAIVHRSGQHNHPADVARIHSTKLRNAIKRKALAYQEQEPDEIIDNELENAVQSVVGHLPSKVALRRLIQKNRKKSENQDRFQQNSQERVEKLETTYYPESSTALNLSNQHAYNISNIIDQNGNNTNEYVAEDIKDIDISETLQRSIIMPEAKILIQEARQALKEAYCPYTEFPVGAALLTHDGRIFRGCNVENASSGATICAERTAIVKAVSEGHRQFIAIAVVTHLEKPASPCGMCRQVMIEFGSFPVYLGSTKSDQIDRTSVQDLLPAAFTPRHMQLFRDGQLMTADNNNTQNNNV